jgi:hypothetical protein
MHTDGTKCFHWQQLIQARNWNLNKELVNQSLCCSYTRVQSAMNLSVMPKQSWTWVTFLWSNPTFPADFVIQPNPIHQKSTNIWPNPTYLTHMSPTNRLDNN